MAKDNFQIGFDVTPILYNRGVSRYTTNIIRALAQTDDVTLKLFGSSFRANRQLRTQITELQKDAGIDTKPTVLAFPPAFLKNMWYGVGRLHIESLMPKVDVFHAWEELIPPSYKTPTVATIHDLALFKFEGIAHPTTKEKHTLALKRLAATHSHVIAVSQQTRRDLLELFSFPEDHVHVIPEAVPSESIVSPKELFTRQEIELRFGIHKPYFLWVGVNEPRKNIDRIIETWKHFSKDFDLVLVGQGLERIRPIPGLFTLRGIGKVELTSLFSKAQLLLFPSLYEGFGLPILEAFYYGCPVVTSHISAMPEVADDAAVLVDPTDIDSLVAGVQNSIENGHNAKSQKKMKDRLKQYSWSESAKKTKEVYRLARRDGK
ncbi:MAG TPA: glycosyltransferase family 1 protein [Patescibacteria group bacterium]|nr:glycosyltransferase family 1 protein [Patescibacteria group bacterium]